jgi:hypothetical protein
MKSLTFLFALFAAVVSSSCSQTITVRSDGGIASPFRTIPLTRTVLVAGGKCIAKLTYKNGELTDVDTDTQGCLWAKPKVRSWSTANRYWTTRTL